MRRIIIGIAYFILFTTYNYADGLMTEEQLNKWMTYYYQKPDPESTPAAIDALSRLGDLRKDTAANPISYFLSYIFRDNGNRLISWLSTINQYSETEQNVIVNGLWLANTNESRECLNRLLAQNKIIEKERTINLLKKIPEKIEEMEINSLTILDMLWGAFLATGDEKYVIRIISALSYFNVKGDVNKLLIGGAARWSLKSNCAQHEKVLKICTTQIKKQPKEISDILIEITKNTE